MAPISWQIYLDRGGGSFAPHRKVFPLPWHSCGLFALIQWWPFCPDTMVAFLPWHSSGLFAQTQWWPFWPDTVMAFLLRHIGGLFAQTHWWPFCPDTVVGGLLGHISNTSPKLFVVHFCVNFNYNCKSPNPLLELGPILQFIIHVDKLPNWFPTPTQHPMRDEVLVMYSKFRPAFLPWHSSDLFALTQWWPFCPDTEVALLPWHSGGPFALTQWWSFCPDREVAFLFWYRGGSFALIEKWPFTSMTIMH